MVETLVAIAIFATSITALISITARGINDNVYVKDKLTASHLAAEGIEFVRNLRDRLVLVDLSSSWESFGANMAPCVNDGSCYMGWWSDYSVSPPISCQGSDGSCPVLNYDPDFGLYGYEFITQSKFTRTITAEVLGSGQEMVITSTVSWTHGQRQHSVSYTYNLLNWYVPN